jgi:hypothetical protein
MRVQSVLAVLALAGLACAAFGRSTAPETRPNDFSVSYSYSIGPLPPEYYYAYALEIASDGQAQIAYSPTYPGDDVPTFDAEFALDEAALDDLYADLRAGGAFDGRWSAVSEGAAPVGGSVERLSITASGQRYDLPEYDPNDDAGLSGLKSRVAAIIPAEVLADLEAQREQYLRDAGLTP